MVITVRNDLPRTCFAFSLLLFFTDCIVYLHIPMSFNAFFQSSLEFSYIPFLSANNIFVIPPYSFCFLILSHFSDLLYLPHLYFPILILFMLHFLLFPFFLTLLDFFICLSDFPTSGHIPTQVSIACAPLLSSHCPLFSSSSHSVSFCLDVHSISSFPCTLFILIFFSSSSPNLFF